MEEIQKTQAIRLYGDVLFIGPFLIYLGLKGGRVSNPERVVLGGIGLATILYNARNYFRQKSALDLERSPYTHTPDI